MKTKEMVVLALLTAILLVCQVGMAFLPNIELVSLLIIIYTKVYRRKVFFIIYAFVFLQGLLYGFGLWWFSYLYVWSILAILVLCMKKEMSSILMAFFSGGYGLSFGFLCAIPYFLGGNINTGFSFFISGIPFDILHGIGNFAVALLLYPMLSKLLIHLNNKIMI